jgi:hypothetical protein
VIQPWFWTSGRQTGSYPKPGIWEASNGCLAKSSSLSPHHRFTIALHSPSALPETGLQTCPLERVRQIDAMRS